MATAGIALKIDSNIPEFKKFLTKMELSEIPFITAKTLTNTAQRAQKLTRLQIQRDFTLRKKSFPNSVKVRIAKKNDLVAELFTRAPFAEIQEEGGRKTPETSSNLLVPIYSSLRTLKPKRLQRSRTNAFLLETRDGRKFLVKKKGKKGGGLDFLYILKSKASIPPRLKMFEITEKVVNKLMPAIFARNFEQIIGRKFK